MIAKLITEMTRKNAPIVVGLDPMLSYNPKEKFIYTLKPLPEICPEDYADLPVPIAARKITDKIKTDIEDALNR